MTISEDSPNYHLLTSLFPQLESLKTLYHVLKDSKEFQKKLTLSSTSKEEKRHELQQLIKDLEELKNKDLQEECIKALRKHDIGKFNGLLRNNIQHLET